MNVYRIDFQHIIVTKAGVKKAKNDWTLVYAETEKEAIVRACDYGREKYTNMYGFRGKLVVTGVSFLFETEKAQEILERMEEACEWEKCSM